MNLESTIAGTWHPGSDSKIRAVIDGWERRRPEEPVERPRPNILILPHAGWAYSGETAWAAGRKVRGAGFRRVVVLAPSHRAWM